MSEQQQRACVRFCPGCGESTLEGANFCTACGAAISSRAVTNTPSRPPLSSWRAQAPGLIVLGGFLILGLSLWIAVLQPERHERLPLAASGAPASAPSVAASFPSNHPPVEIPEQVRSFLGELEQKAAAAPRDVAAWTNLAQVQYRAGQIDRAYLTKAEASFHHVLEIEPENLDALRGLGNVHFDRDDYAGAIESYAAYLQRKPDDADVRTDLGTMYLYGGKEKDAVREYQKVIAAHPDFFQAYFNLGIARMRSGDRAPALEAFQKAKALAPDDSTRNQIQTMIDRSDTAAARGGAPAGGSFQARVEQTLRNHPITGPKVVRFEWPAPTEARVILDQFPISAMPEFVRSKFLDRLKSELGDAKRATGAPGVVRLELVDRESGEVMATVSSE